MFILLTLMWNMIASAGKREWIVNQNISNLIFLVTIYIYDYVIITNEKDFTFGEYVYCGQRTGQTVLITGRLAVIHFYSDNAYMTPPKIILPASAPVIRVLPGFRMTWSATGSPPIYTALIRNTTLLANTSGSMTVQLHEEGNFTCVATSEYGTDVKQFSVVLSDLSVNNITLLPHGIFATMKNLKKLDLSQNFITSLPDGMFASQRDLYTLGKYILILVILYLHWFLFSVFVNFNICLQFHNVLCFHRDLSSNALTTLPLGVFATLKDLSYFCFVKLSLRDLSSNLMTILPDRIFDTTSNLRQFDLSSNNIQNLTKKEFVSLKSLSYLYV
ncbi:unnamed protein product [Porites lobata]|uniref:Ig-like domain-containing protein n=1 Tax=Porites lobata TaxID=104759 RepID=A0ABN8MX22_9CNID|nr:unnamed protein product [Porites lobata]